MILGFVLHFCCMARLTNWQLQKLIEVEAGKAFFTLKCQMKTRIKSADT